MALQNRVTPTGEIIAVPDRGLFTGNRGVLHTGDQRLVRHHVGRRWIICELEFRGRHREVMQSGRWTELFFLDEATALAAGHRPCAQCRYRAYQHFRHCWPVNYGSPLPSASHMDLQMQQDRLEGRGGKCTYQEEIGPLPDGVFIVNEGEPWLLWNSSIHHWTPGGYDWRASLPPHGEITVLTPRSTIQVIQAGYVPAVHPSAGQT